MAWVNSPCDRCGEESTNKWEHYRFCYMCFQKWLRVWEEFFASHEYGRYKYGLTEKP